MLVEPNASEHERYSLWDDLIFLKSYILTFHRSYTSQKALTYKYHYARITILFETKQSIENHPKRKPEAWIFKHIEAQNNKRIDHTLNNIRSGIKGGIA